MTPISGVPADGWKAAASDSYGTDELFRGTARTLVRIFPSAAESVARATHAALIERGVASATFDAITHVDGAMYFYVWAERGEMTRLVPEVIPDGIFGNR